MCIHVHTYLSSLVCTNVCVLTGLALGECVVSLSETSGLLAVSRGSESSVHVCTAVTQRKRPAADIGFQERPSGLKTLVLLGIQTSCVLYHMRGRQQLISYMCVFLVDGSS